MGRPKEFERTVPVALTTQQLLGIKRYQTFSGMSQMAVLRAALDEFLLAESKKRKKAAR